MLSGMLDETGGAAPRTNDFLAVIDELSSSTSIARTSGSTTRFIAFLSFSLHEFDRVRPPATEPERPTAGFGVVRVAGVLPAVHNSRVRTRQEPTLTLRQPRMGKTHRREAGRCHRAGLFHSPTQ